MFPVKSMRKSAHYNHTCPLCMRKFGLKDGLNCRRIAASNPILLHCGHSVCFSCVFATSRMQEAIPCPTCATLTPIADQEDVERNAYLIGLLYDSRQNPNDMSFGVDYNLRMVPAHATNRSNGPVTPPVSCSMCTGSASVVCVECGDRPTCSKCYRMFHSKFGIDHRQHRSIRNRHVSAPICKVHDGKLLEYYCTNDNERICSDCCIVGAHKSHTAVKYVDQIKGVVGDVTEKVKMMRKTNKCLKHSEKYLKSMMKQSEDADEMCTEQIRQHFLLLHGILQRRESHLIRQVQLKAERQHNRISEMIHNFQDKRGQLCNLISDVRFHLESEDSDPVRSFSDGIYESLHEFSDAECYVDCNKLTPKRFFSKFTSAQADLTVIQEYGTVLLGPEVTDFQLKSCRDVDDSLIDDISDDNDEDVPELEMLPVDSSDDSVHSIGSIGSTRSFLPAGSLAPFISSRASSAPHVRKEKQKKRREGPPVRPSSVLCRGPRPRNWTSMKQELVRVSHVCTPGEFYIQRKCDGAILHKQEVAIAAHCKQDCRPSNPDPKDVCKNELYLVHYGVTKSWYRARVIDIVQADEATADDGGSCARTVMYNMFYIDYGNTEHVPIEKMLHIPAQFVTPQPFAIRCCLSSIYPVDKEVGWSHESIQTFTKFVNNKFINMTVFEFDEDNLLVDLGEGSYSLDPTNLTPVSVCDALVFLELGCFSCTVGATETSTTPAPLPLIPACCKFYKNTLPSVNSCVEGFVSYIETPTNFYVQRGDGINEFKAMLDEIHSAYSRLKWDTGLCNPVEGLACVAQHVDGKWYRARVMRALAHRRIKVFYVDFGDMAELPHTQVKAIYSRFLGLPEMAFHCILADVVPGNNGKHWSAEAIEYFTSCTTDAIVKFCVVGHVEHSLLVTVHVCHESQDTCLNFELVSKELAISSGPCSLAECVPLAIGKVSDEPHDSPDGKAVHHNYDEMLAAIAVPKDMADINPPRNAMGQALYNIKVHVSQVESPTVIYVQFIHHDAILKKVIEDIQYAYRKSAYVERIWQEDDMCVVYSTDDKLWHRAIVVEVLPSETAKVFLVDWGRTSVVTVDKLRTISEMFRTLQHFAFRCHFVEIVAPGGTDKWPSVATEFLLDIVNKHEVLFLTKLEEGELQSSSDVKSLPIDLFYEEVSVKGALDPMTTDYWSLTDLLLDQGLALPTKNRRKRRAQNNCTDVEAPTGGYFNFEQAAEEMDDSSISMESDVPIVSEDVSNTSACSLEVPICPMEKWKTPKIPQFAGQRFEALPTNVTNDGLVCMHDTLNAATLLTTIKSTLKSKYENSLPCPRDLYWAPGQACVAQFDMDGSWYRAEVISVLGEQNKIKVLFIDYGNEECVRPDQLRKDVCLLQHPQQGYNCQLFDVAPVSDDGLWPATTLNLMHKIVVDKKCFVTIVIPGTPPKVTIEISEGNTLNDLLVDMQLACTLGEEPAKFISPPQYDLGYSDATVPDMGSNVPVVITAVLNPTSFYVQRICVTEEEAAMRVKCHDTMNTLAGGWPHVAQPKIGGACCARYTEDDVWFRAIITDVDEERGSVGVTYVDYGNKETVDLDRIREIPGELLRMPKQAFLCELFQVCPVDTWTVELEAELLAVVNDAAEDFFVEVMESGTPVQINLNVFVDGREEPQLAYQHLVNSNRLKLVRKKTWEEMA